ncbi:MAG TPA: lytic transglycosylase domain-containing protein [Candidatus Acidoferrales bacterium]|nr:lytic transglycosylase domain-containing protein [Candidatus Acidoferrales bacterium]
MHRLTTLIAILATIAFAGLGASTAQADYAVLRSGVRLHITGYERAGDLVRLSMNGGTVEVQASDLISFEPEDQFAVQPALAPAIGPFGNLIRAAALKHGVDESLITYLIAVESNFNPRAVSRKQARGLMQLIPETAARYSVANIFDPAQNIDAGTHYLKDLLERYRGNLSLALAAYNAGPDMVTRYGGIPPFPETQKYVRQITAKLASTTSSTLIK